MDLSNAIISHLKCYCFIRRGYIHHILQFILLLLFFLSFSTTDEDQQPSLFELADIEESNEALMMPPPPASGGANASMPSLETPLISVDDTLDLNPLVAQITSRKGRKKLS